MKIFQISVHGAVAWDHPCEGGKVGLLIIEGLLPVITPSTPLITQSIAILIAWAFLGIFNQLRI